MLKKQHILLIVIISVVIITLIIFLTIHFRTPKIILKSPFEAIPENTNLLVKIQKTKELFDNADIIDQVSKLEELFGNNDYSMPIKFLIDINNQQKKELFKENPVYIFYFEQNQAFIVNISRDWENTFDDLTKELAKKGKIDVFQKTEPKIIKFSNSEFGTIYFYLKNNLFVVGTSTDILLSAINTQKKKNKSIMENPDFVKVKNSSGIKEFANVFVNFEKIPDFLLKKILQFNLQITNNQWIFAGWTEFDVQINDSKKILTGILNRNDTIVNFLNLIESQNSINFQVDKILPNSTTYFNSIALTNKEEFFENLKLFEINPAVITADEEKFLKSGINIKEEIRLMVKSEICLASNDVDSVIFDGNKYVIFDVNSTDNAIEKFKNIITKYCQYYHLSSNNFFDQIDIDTRNSIQCIKLPCENIPYLAFGAFFKDCEAKYVCCFENFMIFGKSINSIKNLLYNVILRNTLNNNQLYLKFKSDFTENFNFFSYYNHNDIEQIGYQITKTNGIIFNIFAITKTENNILNQKTVWESKLDAPVLSKPFVVKNHINDLKEVLVQDENYSLYLITNQGIILWKFPLEEKISGNITQIDFYENDKLQYAFSTDTKIYIIDRLGNCIENYPIKFRSKATAAMTIFQYDDNKQWRILVPCEDKKIYLYNLKGHLLKDWELPKTENLITTPIFHYDNKGQDYLVAHDDYKLYVLSRTGKEKLKFFTNFKFSNNNISFDSRNNKFVATDTDGIVHFFNISSKTIDTISFKKFSENHKFMFADITGDLKSDYIFTDKDEIFVYDNGKKLLFSYKFDGEILYSPAIYDFGENIYIGIATNSGKIYLINKKGELYDKFPLKGINEFSISYNFDRNSQFNLLVGGSENNLYNYKIK
ncbi:MAG: WD40 repeat domain-containing protein [Bacteroidales bacterium]|jgi:hypothetical protein|nr:WD40 repeat domain-containing protein [Bacteroidales bacterium]